MTSKETEALTRCPFCGELDEINIRENHSTPSMNRTQTVISCDINHWCAREGLPRLSIRVTGRSREEAIAAWNTRAQSHTDIESLKREFDERFIYDPYDCVDSARQGWNNCIDHLASTGRIKESE